MLCSIGPRYQTLLCARTSISRCLKRLHSQTEIVNQIRHYVWYANRAMMAWSSKIHSEIRHNTKHHHLPFWFNQLECQASGVNQIYVFGWHESIRPELGVMVLGHWLCKIMMALLGARWAHQPCSLKGKGTCCRVSMLAVYNICVRLFTTKYWPLPSALCSWSLC